MKSNADQVFSFLGRIPILIYRFFVADFNLEPNVSLHPEWKNNHFSLHPWSWYSFMVDSITTVTLELREYNHLKKQYVFRRKSQVHGCGMEYKPKDDLQVYYHSLMAWMMQMQEGLIKSQAIEAPGKEGQEIT